MDTHPDTVQAISTALGAVAGSLIRDRTTGAYTVQMEAKWNRLTKNRKKTRTNNSNKNYPQKRKKTDELLKLLTEYINMSETAEHPTSRKALHGVWNEEKDVYYRK